MTGGLEPLNNRGLARLGMTGGLACLGITGGAGAPRHDIFSLVIPNRAHGGVRNPQSGIRREGVANSRRFLVVSLLGMTGGLEPRNNRGLALLGMTGGWRLGMTGGWRASP
jgi:hypothetical protein